MVLLLLNPAIAEAAQRVAASERTRFDELIEVAGLDRTRDLRYANWSGIDMSGCDLQGCDFTGANLTGCRFKGARILGARFDVAQVERAALSEGRDWVEYTNGWVRPEVAPATRHLPDLAVFSDVPAAPELVVIPSGRFWMGSSEDEPDRYDDEDPRHEVTIGHRYGLARYPVTFEEYDAFCRATGRALADDHGWGRGRRPAIDVSWDDAEAYCGWLSELTGAEYRLPSESEWEHACRAGTSAAYPWGSEWDPNRANGGEGGPGRTTSVGNYPANDWGLYDMIGNVLEWVRDGWHDSYDGAPADGSAWEDKSEEVCVVRGGSWFDDPWDCRASSRFGFDPVYRDLNLGFRPARTLLPPSS